MAKKIIPKIIQDVNRYKSPPIDWNINTIISHTQLTIFNTCNYRWGLHYRDGFKRFTPSVSLIFGTAIHEVIQEYIEVFYNQSKAAAHRMDMETSFKDKLRSKYLEEFNKNNRIHFSTPEELNEHCTDGIEIIRYFKSKVGTYFSKRGWHLVGCEVPIDYNIKVNVYYKGYLDIVLYHEPTNSIEIIDIKTSTRSWYDSKKKDENKLAQLLLYKIIFANIYQFPIDNINVKFLILKRKINTEGDFPEKRFQEFIPASGKNKRGKAELLLQNFADSVFTDNGIKKTDKFKKNITKDSCMFCPYKDDFELCERGVPSKWRNPFQIF